MLKKNNSLLIQLHSLTILAFLEDCQYLCLTSHNLILALRLSAEVKLLRQMYLKDRLVLIFT
jgi:hypothetical protein